MSDPIFHEEWNGYKKGDPICWRIQIAGKKGSAVREGTFHHVSTYRLAKDYIFVKDNLDCIVTVKKSSVVENK